jgi:hypothetical protein
VIDEGVGRERHGGFQHAGFHPPRLAGARALEQGR